MSKIISIGTAVPKYHSNQSSILEFMHEAYNNEIASRKLKILSHQSGINTRHSVVPDFDNGESPDNFFIKDQAPPTVEKRLNLYKKHAVSLSIDAIQNSLRKLENTVAKFVPTHLITVSCTGLYAPGLGTEIIEQMNLPNDIFHTSINFMGCNAAFQALRIADMIAKTDEKAKVLIVCVELCTLHFQPKNDSNNLLSNTIFGDGAAAAVVVPDSIAKQNNLAGLAINGFYSLLLNRGKDLMAWNITPLNFEMVLDARVPEFIGEEANNIILKAGKYFNITPSSIDKWAIHPGGKKILDVVKKQYLLSDTDLQFSFKVLADYGNMSSTTILFVLNEMMKTQLKPNETIFALGFGPGISIETALFTYGE
ncbi:MAG: type III polyketide synthase [Bacteroidales bacterium]